MAIDILLHNLKLLGFDESKHAKGAVELNELLFTRDAVNNDKAFEYICLFLFRRVDRNRVKKDLMPNLTVRTYGSKQNFITKVHQWLIELRRGCPLFNRIPLRKSELLAYHGDNLTKIMVAFSTFVLKFTLEQEKHNDLLPFAESSTTEIQTHIQQAHQAFELTEESKNTYMNKAFEASSDVNAELASPSPLQAPFSLATVKETRQLNQDLNAIKLLIPDSSSNAMEIQHISPSTSLIENTLPSLNSLKTPSAKIPHISAITDAIPPPNYTPNQSCKPTFSTADTPLKPLEINTLPSLNTMHKSPKSDTSIAPSPAHAKHATHSAQSSFSSSSSFKTAELPAVDTAKLAPIQFSYVKEPCRLPSFRNCFLASSTEPVVESPYWFLPPIYDLTAEIDTSSMLLTQHFSPATIRTSTPSAASTPRKRKASTFDESEDDEDGHQLNAAPPSAKRKIAPEEMQTPPCQIINLEWEDQQEVSPQSLQNLDMVPPLMEESAPFKRIYETEFFDIDFLTPRR